MRPLLWKELRQGRPLLLFSVIAALALAAADVVAMRLKAVEGYGGGPGTALEVALAAVLTVLPLFLALLAGSGLFAAEADHGTIPVLFDPATFADTATFEEPCQHPVGLRAVAVAGRLVIQDGRMTGERAGRFCRPGG